MVPKAKDDLPIPCSSPPCSMEELENGTQPLQYCDVRIKRIYEEPSPADGFRVLVDRLWPRGANRQEAHLGSWLRTIAPSTPLRKWFAHDPRRWQEFRIRYRAELRTHPTEMMQLRQRAALGRVTLLYAARDSQFNHAVILKEAIEQTDPISGFHSRVQE